MTLTKRQKKRVCALWTAALQKINPPNSHPSNQIHKEAHRKAPAPATTKSRRKQGDALCGRSHFDWAVKLRNSPIKKATTARIIGHVRSNRKEMGFPVALKKTHDRTTQAGENRTDFFAYCQ